jgi:hypothetical protein
MDSIRKEVEAARAAIKRAAALVEEHGKEKAEIRRLLEQLEGEVGELAFEFETQDLPPGTAVSRSTARSRSSSK